jgi:glutamate synthase (NADPH) large chain
LKLEVAGDANDYVGKGLSGGTIVVRPSNRASFNSQDNTIIGNTVLYGATSGKLFAAGRAGERFAVRNSGARVVVEGCGANGCEYMTGGIAVILGPVGDNFGAGMTGGMAFVYDAAGDFADHVNHENVLINRLDSNHWETVLMELIEEHQSETHSRWAMTILLNWQAKRGRFWQVVPKEMINRIEHPVSDKAQESAISA